MPDAGANRAGQASTWRFRLFLGGAAATLVVASSALAQSTAAPTAAAQKPIPGPERRLTPPTSIVSPKLARNGAVSIDELFASARSESAVWSVDGRSVHYTSDRSGRMRVWTRPLRGGTARELSSADMRQGGVAATPDGRSVLFYSDKGGRQIFDLFTLPFADGEPVNLTATDDVSEMEPVPSPDGRFIAFARRTATAPSYDIALLDRTDGKVRSLTHEAVDGLQWIPVTVSRDNRYILANRYDWSFTVGEAYLIDVATGDAVRLTPEGVYARAGDISPDGRRVSATIENDEGVQQAVLIDVATREATPVEPRAWEQTAGSFSPDGRSLIVTSNIDGRDSVYLYDIASSELRLLRLPAGVNQFVGYTTPLPAFSPDGKRILFPHTSGSEPMDYWVYDIGSGKARRATDLAGEAARPLPRTEVVHYAGADGTVISALLWMPYNLERDASTPAVVLAHGGPTGQVRDQFDRTAVGLAARGYIVIAPNFRGSTGYGRAFLEANHKDLGGGDLDDVAAGADFLVRSGYVDSKRIGITGGSYGGYMTLMGISRMPTKWAAAVEMFGIVNWRTMWEHGAPQNRRYQTGLIGTPDTDPDVYDRVSPLTYLDEAKAPLLVLHGQNDPLVPIVEARQVVDRLQRLGRTVDAHYYPDEGHGFSKRENQIDVLRRTIEWFDRHLARK